MPNKDSHLAAAERNQQAVDYLKATDDHLAWEVTIAFYKALHIVEAVFVSDPKSSVKHTDDHKTRNLHLKSNNRYSQLWKMYRPLWEASLIARYLRIDETKPTVDLFSQYMPRHIVDSMVKDHYLHQLEVAASKFIGSMPGNAVASQAVRSSPPTPPAAP